MNLKDELKSKINQAIGEASVCWSDTKDGVSGVPVGVFDTERANKISDKLSQWIWDELTGQAWLGNATTGEMLEEIKCRLEVDNKLNYKTVNKE